MGDQELPSEDDVLAAVAGASGRREYATAHDVQDFLSRRHVRDRDLDAVLAILQRLAHAGKLDRVDAAPGPDGLPVYGFHLSTTGTTVAGVVRQPKTPPRWVHGRPVGN